MIPMLLVHIPRLSWKGIPIRRILFFGVCNILLLALWAWPASTSVSAASLTPLGGGGFVPYVHVATASNSFFGCTELNASGLNGWPDAVISVTPDWNPGGSGGVYDNHALSVFYWSYFGSWFICHQDGSAIPTGAAYNIAATPTWFADPTGSFVTTATSSSTFGDFTILDNSYINAQPDMRLLVTPNLDPDRQYDVYDNHPIGVFYIAFLGKWAIYNQDLASMPLNASFNINYWPSSASNTMIQTANASNSFGDYTCIDNASSNGNPNAILSITANWNPNGPGIYNNHNTGVFYSLWRQEWCIFNQDGSAMPAGASFNVVFN